MSTAVLLRPAAARDRPRAVKPVATVPSAVPVWSILPLVQCDAVLSTRHAARPCGCVSVTPTERALFLDIGKGLKGARSRSMYVFWSGVYPSHLPYNPWEGCGISHLTGLRRCYNYGGGPRGAMLSDRSFRSSVIRQITVDGTASQGCRRASVSRRGLPRNLCAGCKCW